MGRRERAACVSTQRTCSGHLISLGRTLDWNAEAEAADQGTDWRLTIPYVCSAPSSWPAPPHPRIDAGH